jgi:hypothetical protein
MAVLALGCSLGVALGGCSTDIGPSAAELKARWDAQNIYPQNFKTDLLAFMRTYLNDPAHIRAAQVSQPQLKSAGQGDRYVVCVRYRERKDSGAYGAPKEGAATYVSAKLDRFFSAPPEMRALCKDVIYEPFPEMEKLTR